MQILNAREIDAQELTPADEEILLEKKCTNCNQKYTKSRPIMVAILKNTTIWWHYPQQRACYD